MVAEIGTTVAIGVASSIPVPRAHCRTLAAIVSAITALYVVYLLAVRPYRTRTDAGFAMANGVAQVGMGLAVLAAVRHDRGSVDYRWVRIAGYCVLVTVGLFFLQAVVAAMLAVKKAQREADEAAFPKPAKPAAGAGDTAATTAVVNAPDAAGVLDAPLLEMATIRDRAAANPLNATQS